MSDKGFTTKQRIKEEAKKLFAKKGFAAVTMKDICESTNLSRGGLYRHYSGTDKIFEDIFKDMSEKSSNSIDKQIVNDIPASKILDEVLNQLRSEMLDSSDSLSLAIYEYSNMVDKNFFIELNRKGIEKWEKLLKYGMNSKAFKIVDSNEIIDIIIYAYQGVRMWSRVIGVEESTANHIIHVIKTLLYENEIV